MAAEAGVKDYGELKNFLKEEFDTPARSADVHEELRTRKMAHSEKVME